MNKELKALLEELNEENKLLFEPLIMYLNRSGLTTVQIEEYCYDLLGMTLEAQLRGETLSDIIGDNYQEFCDQLVESGKKHSLGEKVLQWLYVLSTTLIILLPVFLLVQVFRHSFDIRYCLQHFSVGADDLSYMLLWVVVDLFFQLYFNRKVKREYKGNNDEVKMGIFKKTKQKQYGYLTVLKFIVVVFFDMIFLNDLIGILGLDLFNIQLFDFPFLCAFTPVLVLFVSVHFLLKKKRKSEL